VIPSHNILQPPSLQKKKFDQNKFELGLMLGFKRRNLFVGLGIIDHVLVRIGLSIDARFRAFDGESEGVHHDDGVGVGLALHEAHDLDGAAGARVDDHLE